MPVFAASAVAAPTFLPALVFVAELCVVTLSTVRIICLGRGQKVLASAIGLGLFATGVAASVLLIAAHDRPFIGQISISPGPLLQIMPGEPTKK